MTQQKLFTIKIDTLRDANPEGQMITLKSKLYRT